jgi:nucleoside-diphosphate-sugar epimerase
VLANILASQKDLDSYGEIFNVGTGVGTDIQTIANLISSYQIHIPERPGEVLHSRACNRKIAEQLGWNFNVNVVEWIKKEVTHGHG